MKKILLLLWIVLGSVQADELAPNPSDKPQEDPKTGWCLNPEINKYLRKSILTFCPLALWERVEVRVKKLAKYFCAGT